MHSLEISALNGSKILERFRTVIYGVVIRVEKVVDINKEGEIWECGHGRWKAPWLR